jgi:Fe2+ or Zn2+ uptake regulation protein
VYRNLGALEEAGIVRHSHAAGGAARWAPAAAIRETAECEWCGTRLALEPAAAAQLRALSRRLLGFEAHFDHAPLPGLCSGCAGRARVSGGAVR